MSRDEAARLINATANRLRRQSWLANWLGAAVVFMAIGFVIPIFLEPDERWELGRKNLPFVIAAVVFFGGVLTVLSNRERERALAWIAEQREPTEAEHRRTLLFGKHMAGLVFLGWMASALIFGLINLDHSLGFAAVVTSAVMLGGETTSAFVYLISERTLRPITELALAARQPERSAALGVRDRLLFAWSLGTFAPLIALLVVAVVGITKPGVETEYVAGACIFLGSVAVVTGLVATLVSAKAIAEPVTEVRRAVDRVAAGDLAAQVPIDDASEVGQLQAGFNRMAEGLRERERIRDLFGRQVGQEVAREALRSGTRLGGEEREVGALFVDLVGSTSMALAMPPTEVVRLLNRFFRVVVEVVEEEGGFVNKFEGDAALAVFGAPVADPDPAGRALCAARRLAQRLEREVPEVGFGIGVSAGAAVAGNVGSEQRFEYTVIGDPVNEAARLCDLAKERSERVVASDAALDRAGQAECAEWELGDRTVLRGRLDATVLASPRA